MDPSDLYSDDETANAWWAQFEERTEKAFEETAAFMKKGCGIDPVFDEAALMVQNLFHEWMMLETAVRLRGWRFTNAATDHVQTNPIPQNYSVHYSFLTHPNKSWRVELMRVTQGVSPLHNAYATAPLLEVHHSFKIDDPEGYASISEALHNMRWQCAQTCESTYGRFSYWRLPADSLEWPTFAFVKPRVNLRDLVSATAPEATPENAE